MSTDPRSRDDVQAEQIRALLVGQEHLAQQMTEIVLAHQHIVRRHDEDVVRVERIERTIAETASSLSDVRDVLQTVAALRGGLQVMGWLGSAAKWLASIAIATGLVLALLKFLLQNGTLPPPR